MKDADYMKFAFIEAKCALEAGEVPVGAVITDKNGEIIAKAHNLRETAHDATGHAEILAIREANKRLNSWRLSDCTIYVTLEPCPMCAGAIFASRLSRLVYGATDVRFGAIESVFALLSDEKLNNDIEIRAGVLEDDCSQILKDFFKDRRRFKL